MLAITTAFLVIVAVLALVGSVLWLGLRVIREDESGLVVKKRGEPLAPGRIIALAGEAGYQAELLPPGWHFPLWRFLYRVERVPLLTVRPGEIALVVANDGATLPTERLLGRVVDCDHFQDAIAFLRRGGERGRQLDLLTAGTYRINPALFTVITTQIAAQHGIDHRKLRVTQVPPDTVGIVTTLDGRSITAGDLAGGMVFEHESFQKPQAFIAHGGCRGLQEDVLLAGAWNINPWFAEVEQIPMTEIPIGYVGVVVSYVGKEHQDLTGDAFTHGDLVEKGRKGVWVEPLLPGKHPVNTRVMKVELVPTTNIVLNWGTRTEQHAYDQKLAPITVRSKDGFGFTLEVSQIIHIGMKNAPRVISRVGSMQNLVDHVLQPTVANYFRNSAQAVTVLEFLSARSDRQNEAFRNIKAAVEFYDVECIDTLIGDIQPPAELMKTQTDRKIADELQRTFDVQREAQVKRQQLERETAIANMQGEVVRSEQAVWIAEKDALSAAAAARGRAESTKLAADADAHAHRVRAEAEAEAVRAIGSAKAEASREGAAAVGVDGFVTMQVASTLAENGAKLVPDVAVQSGAGGGSIGDALVAKLLTGALLPKPVTAPALPPGNGASRS
ncbi:MAG: flotillin family protein [Deltaproteobacteria bacterium]|nr:flotillin family protein [Deltaproteobacteria bacterium]